MKRWQWTYSALGTKVIDDPNGRRLPETGCGDGPRYAVPEGDAVGGGAMTLSGGDGAGGHPAALSWLVGEIHDVKEST